MTSRLDGQASDYLRAHAADPVAWFPWGDEAFAVAASRDVPVLVSIGYSSCHWCHVMARESFRDDATAARINRDFVAVKVDREEHPEVDQAFLAAASAFTSQLGWPLTVFTTPEGRPFHAGTYWPAEARGGSPSFTQVLAAVDAAWRERRGGAEQVGARVQSALRAVPSPVGPVPKTDELTIAARRIATDEDPHHGGLGQGAKFPHVAAMRFLLVSGDADDAAVARRAFTAMRSSALFDEVDGGFFRYATRPDWTVPHYERMLVDNAQMIEYALDVGDVDTARRVAAFLFDVLQQPDGGFGTAQDAESEIEGERTEGGYYRAADRSTLDPPAVDAKIVTAYNGLAIAALTRLAQVTDDRVLLGRTVDVATAVVDVARTDQGWVRATRDGIPGRAAATGADLADLALAALRLAAATGDVPWAILGRELLDLARDVPRDATLAALDIPASPEQSDGDEPSALAARALAAIEAWWLGAGDEYRAEAAALVEEASAAALAEPRAHGALLRAAALLGREPRQLVVVGTDTALAARARALDADVFAVVSDEQAEDFERAGFELFAGKRAHDATRVFVCQNGVCRAPITRVEDLD